MDDFSTIFDAKSYDKAYWQTAVPLSLKAMTWMKEQTVDTHADNHCTQFAIKHPLRCGGLLAQPWIYSLLCEAETEYGVRGGDDGTSGWQVGAGLAAMRGDWPE